MRVTSKATPTSGTKDISLVFFGSGPVAAASLKLLARDFTVEAVVTKPQPAHHKDAFPVLELAAELDLPLLVPANKQELSELFKTQPVRSRLGVVIDYGIIIAKEVIDYFPLGIVNSHFSLLPRWRGADPISFSILNGDTETGVSLMLIVEALDEGPLIAQMRTAYPDPLTTPELTQKLIELSHQALQKALPDYVAGKLTPFPQDSTITPTYSRKLTKADGLIDWTKPAEVIEREIRAFIEWPKSRTTLAGKEVIITKAHVVPSNDPDPKPGDVTVEDKLLMIECGQGYLCIDRLKPAGKKAMTAREFLAGHKHLL